VYGFDNRPGLPDRSTIETPFSGARIFRMMRKNSIGAARARLVLGDIKEQQIPFSRNTTPRAGHRTHDLDSTPRPGMP